MSVAYQWAKRASSRQNWEKYDAALELCVRLGPQGGEPCVLERVALTRRKYGDRRLCLSRGQLESDGYATNKEAWVPPASALLRVDVVGEREFHTLLTRVGWLVPGTAGAEAGQGLSCGELLISAPVDVSRKRDGVGGGKRVAALGAVYEESVVEYLRTVEVRKVVWKRRVHGVDLAGMPVARRESLCAVLPGLLVGLQRKGEKPTGRAVHVLGYEDFAVLGAVAPETHSPSAEGMTVFSDAKLDDLTRRAGLAGRVVVRGAEWERVGTGPKDARRPFAWHRLVEVELSTAGVDLAGCRVELEATLGAFLADRGHVFCLGS